MADLKVNTTIGGMLVWTQGNFPLFPTGEQLLYKNHTIYTTFNKPLATDNDFVSKANGGEYLKNVNFLDGLTVKKDNVLSGGLIGGNADGATEVNCNVDIWSTQGLGFRSSPTATRSIWMNLRTGAITSKSTIAAPKFTNVNTPTVDSDLTNKKYVDVITNNLTNLVNDRVKKAGDTMTGVLIAPNLVSNNDATAQNQVPRLSQVVLKGISLDYGTF